MAFKEDRVAGEGINSGIKGSKGRHRAKHKVAVMHHAMRMSRRLSIELAVGLCLKPRAQGVTFSTVGNRGERGNGRKRQQHQQGQTRDMIASHQPPFVGCNQAGHAHAAVRSP